MKSDKPVNTRADAVIRLLGKHEALSFGALQSLLEPAVTEKRLRKVLSSLVTEGAIHRRMFNMYRARSTFFEISEPLRSERGIGTVHNALLIHNDLCAFAVEVLERSYPGAICVREYAIPRSAVLRKVMKYEQKARDSLPDILLVLPGHAGGIPAYIAVEIERSIKSNKRLLRKFNKYATQTLLDGVVYVSDDERVLVALRQKYQSLLANRARRIGHYKDHFLLTAGCPSKQNLVFTNPRNSVGSPVSLDVWMQKLSTVPLPQRRDEPSAQWGGVRPEQITPTLQ